MICWFFTLFCIIFFYFPLIFSFSICCHSINSFTHREWLFKIEFSFWLLLLVLNWIKCEHLKNVPSFWFVLFCFVFRLYSFFLGDKSTRIRKFKKFFFSSIISFFTFFTRFFSVFLFRFYVELFFSTCTSFTHSFTYAKSV